MSHSVHDTTVHLLGRLSEVRQHLDQEAVPIEDPSARFVDVVDSMTLVEFLAVLAGDYGVTVREIEACAGHRFGTVAELAARLHAAGVDQTFEPDRPAGKPDLPIRRCLGWLAGAAARLPDTIHSAGSVNEALHRPAGWLERHAGIFQRRVWATQDPLPAAAEAGHACLEQAGLRTADVGALLVTSEAPPLLTGLAAALHQQLGLAPNVVALEIGGACNGFLTALWTAQKLLDQIDVVLVMAVECTRVTCSFNPDWQARTRPCLAMLWQRPFSVASHEGAMPCRWLQSFWAGMGAGPDYCNWRLPAVAWSCT